MKGQWGEENEEREVHHAVHDVGGPRDAGNLWIPMLYCEKTYKKNVVRKERKDKRSWKWKDKKVES